MKFQRKSVYSKSTAIIAGLMFIVACCIIFQGCEKDERLDIENNDALFQILTDQIEIALKNPSPKSASISDYEFFNKKNDYSDYPESLFNLAKKLKEDYNTESYEDLKIRFNKEIGLIKTPKCFNGKTSEIESKIYQEIVLHLIDKTEPDIIKIFNTVNRFANDFICEEDQRERILYTIESLKLIYIKNNVDLSIPRLKSLTENSYGGYLLTDCQHWCVEGVLERMNWMDWLEFGMNPPLYTAAIYLHCVIVCR